MRQLECDCVRFEAVSFFFLLAKFYAYWSRHVKVNSDSGTFFSDTPCSVLLLLCAEPMDPPENFRIVGEPFNSTFAEFSWDSVDRSPERIQGFFRGYRVSFWVTYTHSTHYDIIPCATSCTFEFRSHFSPSWSNSCVARWTGIRIYHFRSSRATFITQRKRSTCIICIWHQCKKYEYWRPATDLTFWKFLAIPLQRVIRSISCLVL